MLDPLYVLHEEVIDSYLHAPPEELQLVSYVLLGVVSSGRGGRRSFAASTGCSSSGSRVWGSVFCDLIPQARDAGVKGMYKLETLAEESTLVGLATWLAFCLRYASRQFRRLDRRGRVRGAAAPVP
jgi:hypothetical protein